MILHPRNKKLYRKAREIFVLSRCISNYMMHDMSSLLNEKENPYIYFTGDIIRQSDALVPEIIKAETLAFQDDRIQHANDILKLTNRMYKNCERLEQSNSNGKDFVILLRKELKKFKRLQRTWMLTL